MVLFPGCAQLTRSTETNYFQEYQISWSFERNDMCGGLISLLMYGKYFYFFNTDCMALSPEWIRNSSYNVKNPNGTVRVSRIKHVAGIVNNRTTNFPVGTYLSIPMGILGF